MRKEKAGKGGTSQTGGRGGSLWRVLLEGREAYWSGVGGAQVQWILGEGVWQQEERAAPERSSAQIWSGGVGGVHARWRTGKVGGRRGTPLGTPRNLGLYQVSWERDPVSRWKSREGRWGDPLQDK